MATVSTTQQHKVRWSVSATPVVVVDGTDANNMATTTVHENIRKSVGGSGVVTTAGAVDFGGTFADGTSTTPYLNAAASGGGAIGDGDSTFIYVKHTGFIYDTATVLGVATLNVVHVLLDAEICGCLRPGEGWIIPLHGAVSVGAWTAKGITDNIAVEVIGLD